MEPPATNRPTFSRYFGQLWRVVFASSAVLGLLLGVLVLLSEGGQANFTLDFDATLEDALIAAVVVPLAAVPVFVVLSPLSFWIYRLLHRRNAAVDAEPPDA